MHRKCTRIIGKKEKYSILLTVEPRATTTWEWLVYIIAMIYVKQDDVFFLAIWRYGSFIFLVLNITFVIISQTYLNSVSFVSHISNASILQSNPNIHFPLAILEILKLCTYMGSIFRMFGKPLPPLSSSCYVQFNQLNEPKSFQYNFPIWPKTGQSITLFVTVKHCR